MSTWITDRTQEDVNRVKSLHQKAILGTWTEEEQKEWASGMKGALNVKDYNRIESGIKELSAAVFATVSVKTDWTSSDYMTSTDATRWISNVSLIRARCSGKASTPKDFSSMDNLTYESMNQIEQILSDIEEIAKTRVTFSDEYFCGEGQYGF